MEINTEAVNPSASRSQPVDGAMAPNLVFIFSDQQSWDMVGAYGLNPVRTPHLDRLASQGVLFDHCVSSAPVCTPYRGMLLSGQHPLWNNCFDNDRRLLTDVGDSFAEVLGRAGWRNGYVGKWHLYGGDRDRPVPPGPDRHGFDEAFWTNNCHINYDPDHAFYWDGEDKRRFGTWEAAGQTAQALDFLDQQVPGQPFSLFVSYHPPHNHGGGDAERHSGFDAPAEFKAAYDEANVPLRRSVPDNPRSRRMVHGYLAMCTEIDHHVGQILDRLDARGLADSTIVVYTSDHGETFGAHSAPWHKSVPEDVAVRVPLIVRLPDTLPGSPAGTGPDGPRDTRPGGVVTPRRSQLVVGTLDLMPTLLGLMGIDPPDHCQGRDLSEAILCADDDATESAPLFHFAAAWRGVYTRRWTYSVENLDRRPEAMARIATDLRRPAGLRGFNTLYDRQEDPDQLYNLFGQADRPGMRGHLAIAEDLDALTHDWLDRFDDPFPDQTQLAAATSDPASRDGLAGRPIDALVC